MSCYPSPTTSKAFLAFATLGLYSCIYGQSSAFPEVMNLSVLFATILSPEAFFHEPACNDKGHSDVDLNPKP